MTVTGKGKVAGVIGWPISHSLSPRLHGYWLSVYDVDGAYVPLAVRPDRLADALKALPALGFAGANVTVPHKEGALALMDTLDEAAQRIGAVNTVTVDADGRLEGRNTDAYGFLESVRDGVPAWGADNGPAVVLGAGGAARAICVALQDSGVPEIRVLNRTPERAVRLVADFGAPLVSSPWEERAAALDGAALVVNTTILGMSGQPALDLSLDALPVTAVVADIVYTPLETELLQTAAQRGNRVIDGLGMLLHQGRPGFAAWFGHTPEVTPALRAYMLEATA